MKKGEILDKVYKSNLPSRAKQIMFYFINRANTEGTCFPSVRTIASDCGISERTIQRTMKILLEEGFVIKENRYRDNGGQSSNLYKLQTDPEKNIDNQSNCNEEKELESEWKKKDDYKIIETVTFNEYIEKNEIKESNLKSEKQAAFNILVQKIALDDNFIIRPKYQSIFFQYKTEKHNICKAVTPSRFLCHGRGDNLRAP